MSNLYVRRVRAVNNFDYCNTTLNASSGVSGDLSLSMVCYVTWPPSASVEKENDSSWAKVRCEVRDVVGRVVGNDLPGRKRSNVIGKVFLWEDGLCMGLGRISCGYRRHPPVFAGRWEPGTKRVVFGSVFRLLPVVPS